MQFRVIVAVSTAAGMPINQQFSTQDSLTESNDVIDYELVEVNFLIDLHGLCRIKTIQ